MNKYFFYLKPHLKSDQMTQVLPTLAAQYRLKNQTNNDCIKIFSTLQAAKTPESKCIYCIPTPILHLFKEK